MKSNIFGLRQSSLLEPVLQPIISLHFLTLSHTFSYFHTLSQILAHTISTFSMYISVSLFHSFPSTRLSDFYRFLKTFSGYFLTNFVATTVQDRNPKPGLKPVLLNLLIIPCEQNKQGSYKFQSVPGSCVWVCIGLQ